MFVQWCDEDYLQLNATQSKDMLVDFSSRSSQTFNKELVLNLYILRKFSDFKVDLFSQTTPEPCCEGGW